MKKRHLLSLLLALALACGCAACGKKTDEPAAPKEQSVTEAVVGLADDTVVARIADNGATAEMYTYWLGNYCSYLNQYSRLYTGAELDLDQILTDGTTAADYVVQQTRDVIKQQLALENLAAQYGVKLSLEEEAALLSERSDNVSQLGGEENYLAELRKLGISGEGYDRIRRADSLYAALYALACTPGSALYVSDDELADYAAAQGYVTADHILLLTQDSATGAALDEAGKAERYALAQELLARLDASDDPVTLFRQLGDEYSEDPGRQTNPDGYTFTRGTMVAEFESAAYALGENEYSGIVETSYGYHILLRRPLDRAAAIEEVREPHFSAWFSAATADAVLETTPEMERFDVRAIYAALKELQEPAA